MPRRTKRTVDTHRVHVHGQLGHRQFVADPRVDDCCDHRMGGEAALQPPVELRLPVVECAATPVRRRGPSAAVDDLVGPAKEAIQRVHRRPDLRGQLARGPVERRVMAPLHAPADPVRRAEPRIRDGPHGSGRRRTAPQQQMTCAGHTHDPDRTGAARCNHARALAPKPDEVSHLRVSTALSGTRRLPGMSSAGAGRRVDGSQRPGWRTAQASRWHRRARRASARRRCGPTGARARRGRYRRSPRARGVRDHLRFPTRSERKAGR